MKSEHQTEICQIRQLLLKEKNLVITNRNLKGPLTQSYIFVEEDNNTFIKYALKIQNIAVEGSGEIDQLKLLKCKNGVQFIKDCCHQSIGEVVDEFVIEKYHFTQFQDIFCSLNDWVRQNQGRKISDYKFVSFAGKILDGLEFIHEKQCFLKDISLDTLLINKDDEVKICSVCQDSSDLISLQNQSQNFIQSLPYKPPEYIEKIYNKESYNYTKQGDIWSYGACLSFLGGGQIKQVQKNKNESQFMITYCHNISKKSNEFHPKSYYKHRIRINKYTRRR
ncbi:kinase domain protein (macronuclear) [Tetrahymena thermophila SB210]|uniref:Kinase domain protein n=1 Tax=Tetrahymena thermophila (strain SB210) TaxID=312017 RepID=W7XKE5_TETTS|nr:kinase domain protein [Tetrahymena thermophila SB210]EWS76461.1 kinase domain protein [Tetrahymena thermophila SB210]|eukprot:XP_012651003.1 kinase domain protein [Tetrahymena thermophila SB210]